MSKPPSSAALLVAALAIAVALVARLMAQAVVTPAVAPFVTVREPVVALEHVRIIDGTGAAARDDQTVLIVNGKIAASASAAQVRVPRGARRIDLTGRTVIPGLVGLHEHLYYALGVDGPTTEHAFSFPRMYLAGGITTARTAGGFDVSRDLQAKRDIDIGLAPGPKLLVTAGYMEGVPPASRQMTKITTAEEARSFVDYWASRGAHSFKAYTHIPRAALAAAIDAAHRRGLTVTGHLCSVTFGEAADLGIDNLEHGFLVASDWVADKQPDDCPATQASAFERLDAAAPQVRDLIASLVAHRVAITSTLAVTELPQVQPRFREALAPEALAAFMAGRRTHDGGGAAPADLRKEVALERMFVRAGGLLVAGADPTGEGQVLPGFGDQRNIELLVEGGFTPAEAIRIATLNGARLLGLSDRIGSITVGKQADLVVIDGNPVARIEDIEHVTTVFLDGVGFDSARLLASVKGQVGLR